MKNSILIFFLFLSNVATYTQSGDWEFVVMPPPVENPQNHFYDFRRLWVLEDGTMMVVNHDAKKYIYQNGNWELINIDVPTYSSIFVDKNEIYISDFNSLYVSKDHGKSFTKKTFHGNIHNVQSESITLLLRYPPAFSFSFDDGETWDSLSAPIAQKYAFPNSRFALGSNGNLAFFLKEFTQPLSKELFFLKEVNLITNEEIKRDGSFSNINSWAYANEGENLYLVTWENDIKPFFKVARKYGSSSTVSLPHPSFPAYQIYLDKFGGIYCYGTGILLHSIDEGKNWKNIFPINLIDDSLIPVIGKDNHLYGISFHNGIFRYKPGMQQARRMNITLYEDLNGNCQKDANEVATENLIKVQHDGNQYLSKQGQCSFRIFSDILLTLKLIYDDKLYDVCNDSMIIPTTANDTEVGIPFKIIDPTSIPVIHKNVLASLTPNFGNGLTKINVKNLLMNNHVPYNVFNLQGKQIKSGLYELETMLDLTDLKNGIYFIELLVDGESVNLKYIRF